MQISTPTLLASQQQAVRVTPRPAQPADGFAPLSFKQAAKPAPVPEAKPAAQAQPSFGMAPVRPGTHIDIKV